MLSTESCVALGKVPMGHVTMWDYYCLALWQRFLGGFWFYTVPFVYAVSFNLFLLLPHLFSYLCICMMLFRYGLGWQTCFG